MRRLGTALVCALVCACLSAVPTESAQGAEVECQQVSADQVRHGSPLLEAPLAAGSEACFELPGDADDAFFIALPQGAGVADWLLVEDATGTTVCTPTQDDWPLCRPDGEAPFRLLVIDRDQAAGEPVTIGARVLRVSADTGCPTISAQPLGTQAQLSGSSVNDFRCYSFSLPSGGMPKLSMRSTGYAVGRLIDPDGRPVCVDPFHPDCAPPGTLTEGTLIVGGAPYRVAFYDVGSSDGCRTGLKANWGSTPVSGRVRDLVQLDCWLVPGVAGETVVPSLDSWEVGLGFIDGDGESACAVDTQCRLVGPPPYRMIVGDLAQQLTSAAIPIDYRAVVNSLAPGSGCPLLTPRPFGQAATDRHPGIGCRQFDAQPGQRLVVNVVDLTDDPLFGAAVIGPDGRFPDGPGPFFDNPPGRYSIVTNAFGADFLTALHTVADSSGCDDLATDLTAVTTKLPLATADCYRLTGTVPGDQIRPIPRVTVLMATLSVVVVDALGTPACDPEEFGFCTLAGVPPFRVVIGRDAGAHEGPTPYLFAVLDKDDPPTCRPVALGSRSGVLVELTAQRPIECLTLPSVPDGTTAVHVRRLVGSGGSALVNVPDSVGCDDPGWFSPVRRYRCYDPGAPSAHDVLIVGDGHDQIAYVAATGPGVSTVDEPGITRFVNTTRPRLRGTPVVGRRLRVDPGRWAPGVPDINFTYRWFVDGRAVGGARSKSLKLRPGYAGKKVRVEVRAATETIFSGTAKSASVRARRR